jgi:hypothetical protein
MRATCVSRALQGEGFRAVELNVGLLRELAAEMHASATATESNDIAPLFAQGIDGAALDCALRLMRLLDQPEAIAILHPGLMRELRVSQFTREYARMFGAPPKRDSLSAAHRSQQRGAGAAASRTTA